MVYILLGTGFEETEALAPCDILRRGGVEVMLVGVSGSTVTGGHNIKVMANCGLGDIDWSNLEMIVVPGGLGGVESLEASKEVGDVLKKANKMGAWVAAICAGPRVLTGLKIADGKNIVCYPGMEDQMKGAAVVKGKTCVDGNVITGQAAGSAIDFGLCLLEKLRGAQCAMEVKRNIHYED